MSKLISWAACALLLLADSTVGNVIPRNSVPSNQKRDMKCDREYFHMTQADIDTTDFPKWYQDWTVEARKEPGFQEYGEVQYFGQKWLANFDYDCALGLFGCTHRLVCSDVYSMYPDDKELARNIYWSMLQHHNINNGVHGFHDGIVQGLELSAAKVRKAAEDFMQKTDAAALAKCANIKAAIDSLVQIGLAVVSALSAGALSAVPVDAVADIAQSTATNFGQNFANQFKNEWKSQAVGMANTVVSIYIGQPLSIAYDHGMCAGFDGEYEADPEQASVELSLFLAETAKNMLERNSDLSHDLNWGSFQGNATDVPSDMALMMGSAWASNSATRSRLRNPYKLITKRVVKQFSEVIASSASRASQCYMKCKAIPDVNEYTAICNSDKDYLAMSRVCLDENIACQAECITFSVKSRVVPFHGATSMSSSPWDLSPAECFENSFRHYQAYGNVFTGIQDAEWLSQNKSGYVLPVCYSEPGYLSITDPWRKSKDPDKMKYKDVQVFPPSCGDKYSSATADFLRAMTWEHSSERRNSSDLERIFKRNLPKNIKKFTKNPLERFMAICENGMHWPVAGDPFRLREGPSPYCADIKSDIASMNPDEATVYFCNRRFLEKELGHVDADGLGLVASHERMCKRAMRVMRKEGKAEKLKLEGKEKKAAKARGEKESGRWVLKGGVEVMVSVAGKVESDSEVESENMRTTEGEAAALAMGVSAETEIEEGEDEVSDADDSDNKGSETVLSEDEVDKMVEGLDMPVWEEEEAF